MEQGISNGQLSVRPSVHLSVTSIDSSSGWFAAERGRLQQIGLSIDRTAANVGSVMIRAVGRGSTRRLNTGEKMDSDLACHMLVCINLQER